MTHQLVLLDEHTPDYRMDEDTRQRGRKGVAKARAALAAARKRSHDPEHSHKTAA